MFEATGAYHRSLEKFLTAHDLPFVKVNPKQARRFAQAIGKLAKTDRVDAEMLSRTGSALDLQRQAATARKPARSQGNADGGAGP